ncbi:hypothetical protein DXG01_003652 [Tephrocybe rancida]|nr:hypothetical protein DXG01_003652 [Tephrocybe rancida]
MFVKIIHLTKDELPHCWVKGAPSKPIPLFLSANSEDEDENGKVECVLDHEDDLLPTILQQKAMAEAKSAQEEYAPKKKEIEVEERSLALDAAIAHLSSPDQTERSPVMEGNSNSAPAPLFNKPIVLDAMDVDPEDDILNYGMSDNKTQPIIPTETLILAAEPSITTAKKSHSLRPEEGGTSNINNDVSQTESQPNPVLDMISRREARTLGVIDLIATRRPTEFLVVTGAPTGDIIWADYLTTMAHLIEDGSLYEGQFIQVVWTLQWGEQLFWMRSPSDRATIAGRGYLLARYTIDGVTLNCSFVLHTEYIDAWRRHTNVWLEEDISEFDPPPPDSSITTTSTVVRAPLPPSIAYRFGVPVHLSDRAAEKEAIEEEPQVLLEQRLSSEPSTSLLRQMQVPEAPSLVDRLGAVGSSVMKNSNLEGQDGDDKDEDMEELPGNKCRPWKPHGKRAGKKHHKEPFGNPSTKNQH